MGMTEHTIQELTAIDFGSDDSLVMLDIVQRFFKQWDSGGSVSIARPMLMRLLYGKPLTPLTGEESEWFVPDACESDLHQNRRCTSVFKRKSDGSAFDVDTGLDVTFPYMPVIVF